MIAQTAIRCAVVEQDAAFIPSRSFIAETYTEFQNPCQPKWGPLGSLQNSEEAYLPAASSF